MPLRTVTYDLHRFSGDTPQIGATLKVTLLKAFATATQTYDAGAVEATIDSDGAGQFDLAVPATGTASYLFTLPSGKTYKVPLAAGPTTTLEALINAAASVAVPQNTVQAAVDAAVTNVLQSTAFLNALTSRLIAGANITITPVNGTLVIAASDSTLPTFNSTFDLSQPANARFAGAF